MTTGQVVVDPDHRRRGVGTRVVRAVLARSPEAQFWAVGDRPAAQALARRTGMGVGRELLRMHRSLEIEWPSKPTPDGVELRTFRPGLDDQAWLAVNARAFAHHLEQGAVTHADLAERMAEPWFDPAGFFLAERGDALLGFHWTKQHPDHLGEVYVLGIDPAAAGLGLGKVLLGRGLQHLRDAGNTSVQLYAEADLAHVVRLYEQYGFATVQRDVMYRVV